MKAPAFVVRNPSVQLWLFLLTYTLHGKLFCLWQQGVNIDSNRWPWLTSTGPVSGTTSGKANRVSVVCIVCTVPSTSTAFCQEDSDLISTRHQRKHVTTAAKKTEPDQPKQPGERTQVVKHVTVAQRVDKYGPSGLYNKWAPDLNVVGGR